MWLVAVLAVGNVVQRRVVDHGVSYVGKLFATDALLELDVVFNTSGTASVFPSTVALPTKLFTYRMIQDSPVTSGVVTTSISYAIIAPATLVEFSLIELYKTSFVFLGPPPVEFEPHLIELGCTDANLSSFRFPGEVDGQPVILDFAVDRHTVTPAVCGHGELVINALTVPVWIDCANSVAGPDVVLSGSKLGLGFYAGEQLCLYRGNNDEINHVMAITVVAVLFIFLVVWIDWTRDLWRRVLTNQSDEVWETVVAYSLVVYQYIGLIVSMNIFAWAQGTHSMYSFASLRMVRKETVDATALVYSYVVSPLCGLYALLCMSFARATYGDRPKPLKKWFTWGVEFLEDKTIIFRGCTTLGVLAATGVVIYGVWFVGVGDFNGGIATSVTVFPVVLSWSSPHFLVDRIESVDFVDFKSSLLIMFAWTMKFLIITCLCNNLPFDVAGHLNNTFHSGVTFAMGCALLIITGRDTAHTLLTTRAAGAEAATGVALLLLPVVGFVLWYVTLFNLGGMYSNSGALQNHGWLATLCSGSFSVFIYSLAFSVSVSHGRLTAHDKRA